VRCGRDRDRLSFRLEPGVPACAEHVWKASRVDRAHVEKDVVGAVGVHAVEDRRGDLVPWCELVREPARGRVQQHRSLAPKRLRQERAVAFTRQCQRGRVELAELQIRQVGAGGVGEEGAGPDGSPGVGRSTPQRRATAGGQDRRSGRQGAVPREHAGAAFPVAPQGDHRAAFENLDARLRRHELDQPVGERLAGGAAARMDDPPSRVASFQSQRQGAVGLRVEADPAGDELSNRARCLIGQRLDRGGSAQATARLQGVLGMSPGRVIRAQRGGEPALRPVAGALAHGLGEPLSRDERHAGTGLGGAQRGVEPRGARPDHGHVRLC